MRRYHVAIEIISHFVQKEQLTCAGLPCLTIISNFRLLCVRTYSWLSSTVHALVSVEES